MQFSRHLLAACLTGLRALLYLTAALILLLLVVQHLRDDAGAAPGQLAIAAALIAGAGWGAGRVARLAAG